MDELGKLLNNILSSTPSNTENTEKSEDKVQPVQNDPPSTSSKADIFEPAAEAGSFGNMDFSGLLNSFSSPGPHKSQRTALMTALKPYLRPARRSKLERAQNLISAAYSVRTVLSTLSTLEGVRDV